MNALAVGLGVVVTCVVSGAWAQVPDGSRVSDPLLEDPTPPHVPELRESGRWLAGFDVRLGVIAAGCVGCDATVGGLSVGVQAGYQVAQRVAVVMDWWALAHPISAQREENGLLTHTVLGPAARVWVRPTLWLQGGLGLALLAQTTTGEDEYAVTPALSLGLGGELRHGPGSGIDLSMRLGLGRYADPEERGFTLAQIAIAIGWHWN